MTYPKFKRMYFALALILLVGVAVTGCMNDAANEGNINRNDSVQPVPAPSFMPESTQLNGGATQTAATGYDWSRNATQVEAKIGQISEIDQARVVVEGDTALVGVVFNNAYRGEMTERIREMVAAEVMAADPEITTVAVTADKDDVDDIFELSDEVLAGEKMDDLKEDIGEIVRNATTLR